MSDKPLGFHEAVRMMRRLPPRLQLMAVYAATYWSDADLERAEQNGDLPGRPVDAKPAAEPLQ